MSEKPRKRLVSKGQYAWMVVKRTALLTCSVLLALEGVRDVVGVVKSIVILMSKGLNFSAPLVLMLCVAILIPPGMIFFAFRLWKRERAIERVLPITNHTTSSLPPEETLVRPSYLPPSQQQTELLRAAHPGQETPPKELLRATGGQE